MVNNCMSLRNSAWVSGRLSEIITSRAIGWLSSSCAAICSSVISIGTRVSVRDGSWSSTS